MRREIKLSQTWVLGERIGGGGFGQVFAAQSDDENAVVKLVPKSEGAERELLFVDLEGVPNIVPIIDSGETPDNWVIVMPRAGESLRQHLQQQGGVLSVDDAVAILKDICDALVKLDGRVVHRDLKPENVLLLSGTWCLADFGISRYAEATTAPDTRKYAMSPPYAAPERWRDERATSAADVYSLAVIAYELIMGHRPFEGSTPAELREQHLHADPAPVEGAPLGLSALIDECLFKAPEARPSPANVHQRLGRIAQPSNSPGLSRLEEANLADIRRKAEENRALSVAQSESERRTKLANAAQRSFERISDRLRIAITEAASSSNLVENARGEWGLKLGLASLQLGSMERQQQDAWGRFGRPAFDVVCASTISLRIPKDSYGYEGRSHSLWYCDAVNEGEFGWFELAFMISPLMRTTSTQIPFALSPSDGAAQALSPAIAELQVAWPFTALILDDLDEFVDRWAGWFADAVGGRLSSPRSMPERDPQGSWRRS